MGFNNSPNRGHKFVQNINSRFSEMIVRGQLGGLLNDESQQHIATFATMIKNWFESKSGAPQDKPRYYDEIGGDVFYDGKPKRILLSKYKEYDGCDFFAIGMNYGVLVGKTLVVALGGHEMVTRIIAYQGLVGVWAECLKLDIKTQQICKDEMAKLAEAIKMETRDV